MEEGDFASFFSLERWRHAPREQQDPPPSDEDVNAASFDLSFSNHPAYAKFMEWLEKEADRPVQTHADTHEMISGITRQNTMKEVRDFLRRQTRQAQETLARHRESTSG